MEDEEKKFCRRLEDRSYRYLQQMAKSMGLPSNYKKVYLIELIHAKTFKSEMVVSNIIRRVKLERLQLSQKRRENRINKLVNDTNTDTSIACFSPPITETPKRSKHVKNTRRYNSEQMKSLVSYNPKRNLLQNINHSSSSDRVLRSCSTKTAKPNYALMNGEETILDSKETRVKVVNRSFPKLNVTDKIVVKKYKPYVLSTMEKQITIKQADILKNPMHIRQRTISGIYPVLPEVPMPQSKSLRTTDSVCIIKKDGNVSKISAFVQKRNDIVPRPKNNYRNVQNISYINSVQSTTTNLPENYNNNYYLQLQYPNISSVDVNSNLNPQVTSVLIGNNAKENHSEAYATYYHKKIRSEQIRNQKLQEIKQSEKLPKISEVFSRFNYTRRMDLTQPLYVQVSTESERSQNKHFYTSNCNSRKEKTIMLENMYNFKNQSVTTYTPLLQVVTTPETNCVYTASTVATPIAHPSTVMSNDAYDSSFEEDGRSNVDPHLYDFLQFPEEIKKTFDLNDELFTSTSSLDMSQDLSTCATIPEMVEDALEIISQDGDYMERISMDMGVECVFCPWEGSKIILEYHIRKEHPNEIVKNFTSLWNITYSLDTLYSRRWLTRILEHDSGLYALNAAADPVSCPGCFLATLQSLSPEMYQKVGSITVYNKVSGQPFTWNGPIQPYLHYDNINDCLKVELSKLDLIPNSANLKLFNRELVSDSQSKAIVGTQMLSNIHVAISVKISN